MNATSRFLPSASSPVSVDEPSASTWPCRHPLALVDDRLLVDDRALVRAPPLDQVVGVVAVLGGDHDPLGVDVLDLAGAAGQRHVAGVHRGPVLEAGADQRRLGAPSAAPPGAACSSPSGRGWRRCARGTGSAPSPPTRSGPGRRPCSRPGVASTWTGTPSRVRQSTGETSLPFLSISALAWAIVYFSSWSASRYSIVVGDLALHDLAVRRLHEAVLRHLGVGAERADQADVRAFRGLDRAHAAVVGRVHVAHLDRRALAGQAAGAQRRQAAAVREAGQRVRLIHELATAARSRRTPSARPPPAGC